MTLLCSDVSSLIIIDHGTRISSLPAVHPLLWCVTSLVAEGINGDDCLGDCKLNTFPVVNIALLDGLVQDVLEDCIPSLDSSELLWAL